MRFSFVMLPDYPLADTIESIKVADELGYYACYAADETWHKDLWLLFAAAADKTTNIRFGPNLSPVTLREPTLIAQAAATLDEITGGRAECVISSGNFGLLAQYGIDWTKTKPLSRVREAHHVMRTLLDDGAITFDGEFFSYTGLFTFARPVQQPFPLKLGAMRGPRSFQVAGEIADGCHHALSYTRSAYEFMVDNIKVGAERAGRDWKSLDLGAWVVFAVGADGAASRDAARSMVGIYASSMPAEQLQRNGVEPASLTGIIEAVGAGDLGRAFELTTPDIVDKLSIAGTPDECAAKLGDIASTGINHMILAITDPALVTAFTGKTIAGLDDMRTQLRTVHREIMPAFA